MLDPHSLDAIVELLFIYLIPSFFYFLFLNHFTFLDPWKYFAFTGTNDLLGFTEIEDVLSFAGINDFLSFAIIFISQYGLQGP